MNLKKAALRSCKEKMEAWDPVTETFIPDAFRARIDLTDRFLSNFNRPTRRRMLFADSEAVFPESRVCRHPGTKDVYMMGVTRKDALGGNPYVGLTILQLVTDEPGGSAGLATIYRRVPMGPPEDPGWLVNSVFARTWVDTEFLTSNDETYTTDLRIERYVAFLPMPVQPEEWDFLVLHGVEYRVLDTFSDSGFFSLRIDHEKDYRSDFVLSHTTRVMDRTTRQYVDTVKKYNVTGMLEKVTSVALWATDSEDAKTVYFNADHFPVGIAEKVDQMTISLNGVERQVRAMESQAGSRQFKMRLK